MAKKDYKNKGFRPGKATPPPVAENILPPKPRILRVRQEPIAPEDLTLLGEYLLLAPPRRLETLAISKGLAKIPPEWAVTALRGDWAGQAQTYDELYGESRIRDNWLAAIKLQRDAMTIGDELLDDAADLGILNDKDAAACLNARVNAYKVVIATKLLVLEGLQKPESISGIQSASAPSRHGQPVSLDLWVEPNQPMTRKIFEELRAAKPIDAASDSLQPSSPSED
jgi:hypothetical protein